MTVVEQPKRGGLVARVQAILLRPKAEWDVIDTEPATVQGLYAGYACILAAIPAVAGMIGGLFPTCILGVCIHLNPIYVIVGGIVRYVVALVGLYLTALIIDALAPNFGGQKNQIQALKVAVYSMTAAWLAGIFLILPMLAPLSIVGLYSLYLYYVGLPKLMKAPQDKALVYTIVSIILSFIVMAIAYSIGNAVAHVGSGGPGVIVGANGYPGARVTVGNANVDLGKMQAAAAAAAASATAIEAAQAKGKGAAAIDPAKLKGFLPDTVAGLPRTEISDQSAGAAGVSGSTAEAVYSKDAARITVTVTDLAAAGAFAGIASAMNVQSNKETATGYEKVGNVGGRMTTEQWDRNSNSGKFGVLVANRFMIQAEGSGTSIDALKSAVAAVGPDRLEGLAKA